MNYWRNIIHEITAPKKSLETKKKRFIQRYQFSGFSDKCYLTPQEVKCVDYALQGLTIKEIGEALCLSHRTVEFYLKRIRERFNIKTKRDLIKRFSESDFRHQFPLSKIKH